MQNLKWLILLVLISPVAQAQVMKCTDAQGNITFSDGGCRSNHKTATVVINTSQNTQSTGDRYRSRSNYSDYSSNYETQENTGYRGNDAWNSYKNNNEKARKFSADRQHAREYDDEIRLANEARMRNMDKNQTYNPYAPNAYTSNSYPSNPYASNRRACRFNDSQMVCN